MAKVMLAISFQAAEYKPTTQQHKNRYTSGCPHAHPYCSSIILTLSLIGLIWKTIYKKKTITFEPLMNLLTDGIYQQIFYIGGFSSTNT